MPLLLAALFFIVPQFANAMVVLSSTVQSDLDNAVLVAKIETLSVETFPDPTLTTVYRALVKISSIERVKDDGGAFPTVGGAITITGLGGEYKDIGMIVTGYPRPKVTKKYLAYLKRNGPDFSITGFDEGLLSLDPQERKASRNRTDGSNGQGSGAFLFWDDTFFPVPYYISFATMKGLDGFEKAIDASFKTWRDVQESRLEFLPMGCSTTVRNENDGINSIILIDKDWPFDTGAIAITRNFYIAGNSPKSGLILDSDILLNGDLHKFTVTGEAGKHDLQNIVTHETGHFIGLGHDVAPSEVDAVMYATATAGETKKRVLHQSDIVGLLSAYGGGVKKNNFVAGACSLSIHNNTGCLAVHREGSAGAIPFFAYLTFFISCLALVARLLFGKRSMSSW